MGSVLWLLTVTNRVEKGSKKPDAFTAIQNKFCHRDWGLDSIALLHSAKYRKSPSSSTFIGGPSCFDSAEMIAITESEKWSLNQILQFLQAARIVLTHIQLLVKIILKLHKYCQGRKISGVTINFIKIYSRCYMEDEYSFQMASSAFTLSL